MILTVGNTKGGVGKTTLAINLAVARALQGKRVWLIDGDRQGTAETAIALRAESNQEPHIACSSYSDGKILGQQLKLQAGNFDDVVIDAGGRDSTALRASLMLSDVLIVPFQPKTFDVWALGDIAELIDEVNTYRPQLKAYAVLNCADTNEKSTDNRDAAEAVSQFPQLTYLSALLRRRKAFSNAAGFGLCVLEKRPNLPTDVKAIAELNLLVKQIFE